LRVKDLEFSICEELGSPKSLLIPIPLTFEEDRVSIFFSGQLISSIDIESRDYRESRITISNQDFVSPPNAMLERIKEEYSQSISAKNVFNLKKNTSKEMIIPLEGIMSSEYGVKRFINEQPRNRHIGLDIAAAEGRPIFAPLNGKVILAGNFFYKGNVIFIDHGNGLVSSYSHLSKKLVDLNQIVTAGDNIGLVGSTGRVTGPHLHWEVYFLGIPINPEIFIKN
jgi:murein DD-endopeptidase MepM/ murein hydrolase activator NlpD